MTVLKKFFGSRKAWAFLAGLATLIGASLEDGVFVAQEIQAISALVIGYVFSVAWEDGKHAEAAGNVNAAAVTATKPEPPAVGIDANTVNVQEGKP